eukprot:14005491-Ditylum_brightwellii.AAC.1
MPLGQHGCHPETNWNWHLADVAVVASIQSTNNMMSKKELDSHDNMPCMGRDALVVSDTGRVME